MIAAVITPDRKDWRAVEQAPRPAGPIAGDTARRGAHRQAGMGVMKAVHAIGIPTASAIEDVWQRRATAAAIEAARKVVKVDGVIPPGTPIGRLGDVEWGWIVAAILFGWISTRAEQATAENIDTERAIRMTALDPEPWDAGAVATILPELAETPDIDWSKPLGAWPRETMVEFLLVAMRLIRKAMIARDISETGHHPENPAPIRIARQANAAAGGPLMTPDELNDEIKL